MLLLQYKNNSFSCYGLFCLIDCTEPLTNLDNDIFSYDSLRYLVKLI